MKCKEFSSKAILLCLALIGWAGAAQAETVNVSNQEGFASAYTTAANATEGTETTIVMAAGNYDGTSIRQNQLEIPMVRKVTLQAADGAAVSLKIKVRSYEAARSGSLIFDGIKIIPTDTYFMDLGGNTSNIGDLIFRNCEITSDGSFNRCLIVGGNAANTINNIVIENCRIHDCGNSYNFIWSQHLVKSVSVTNSTLYNYGGESLFYARVKNQEFAFNFTFCNNTVYQWSNTSSSRRAFAAVGDNFSSSSTYTFKDNIICGYQGYTEGSTVTNDNFVLVQTSNGGVINILNNILLGFKNDDATPNKDKTIWGTGTITKTITNAWPYDGDLNTTFGFTNIPFADAANGDFTLDITNYPKLATCSTVGSMIGAPQHGKYTLTVGAAKAATLTLPFETTIPGGVKAYTLSYTSGDNATATPVETTLPAHTPVLVNAEAGSYAFSATGTVESVAGTPQHGAMTGAYILTDVPTGSYVLQNQGGNVGFYKVASGTPQKIKPFRAYLTAGSLAHMLNIDFGSETTVINKVRSSVPMVSGEYYTLHGQRVVHPTKGLYIVNGKKVLVK